MRLSTKLPELDAIDCQTCGAALEPTALVAHLKCHHCGGQQAMPQEVQGRLGAYRDAVQQQIPRIVAALDDADLFVHEHGTETRVNFGIALLGVGFLITFCCGPASCLVIDDQTYWDTIAIVFFIVIPLAWIPIIFGVRLYRKLTRKKNVYRVSPPDVDARCSGCGGDNVMRGGQALSACQYCRAPMVASPAKIAIVVDAVRGLRRSAALKQHATKRHVNGPRANVPLAYRGNEQWYLKQTSAAYTDPSWAPYQGWLERTASALGGRVLAGDESVAWLDATFAGDHPPTASGWGHPRGAVLLEAEGYAALIDLSVRLGNASIGVLIGTEEPDTVGGGPPEVRAELAHRGFDLLVSQGGLWASASAQANAQLGSGPAPDAELRFIIGKLTHAARQLGLGTPPTPLPLPAAA